MEIISSQNLLELADGKTSSVYTGSKKFFFENCNGGMTWIFSDEFTDENTKGFKPRQPSRDVSLTPVKSPTVIPTKYFRR
jgi:hypothetical protein